MASSRARINIYCPTVKRFPEFNLIGGYRGRSVDLAKEHNLLETGKLEPSAVAELEAAVLEDDAGVEGSGRTLFVIDNKGRMLEHVRFQGNDYRGALRAAINTTTTTRH